MKYNHIQIAKPKDEEAVIATTVFQGSYYWNFKYPFRHYKEPRLFYATSKAVYEIITTLTPTK
jgi:hypothetical protein